MTETTILTGKIVTNGLSASNAHAKKMYIKIFPGEFTMRPPRPKKAKVLVGELLIRYSRREWPEKKNGPLIGDAGVLEGIKGILKTVGLINVDDIAWAEKQRDLKETMTLRVGTALAQEIIDRGYASIT